MGTGRTCRFCGLALAAGAVNEWHPACVDAQDDHRPPEGDHAHPMYGPKIVPNYQG